MGDPTTMLAEIAREKSDYRITAKIVDALGVGIPAANLASLTMTLYVLDAALTVIVATTSILNVGRGLVDVNGNLTLTLAIADNVIVDTTALEEIHVALIEWTYNGGASAGRHNLAFRIRNLAKVA